MNFCEKFPSTTREVHIDLNLYRPEPDTPVSDWIEYALLIENPEIVVKKRTVENLGFFNGFDAGFSVVTLSKAKKATAYDLFTPADDLTLCIPKAGDKVFTRIP